MGINYSLDKTFEASNIETLCAATDTCQRHPSLCASDFYYQTNNFGSLIFFCYAQNYHCNLFYKFRRAKNKNTERKQNGTSDLIIYA